jgi:protein-L-isoaspartate(D-aspartate) O-methyltransferase
MARWPRLFARAARSDVAGGPETLTAGLARLIAHLRAEKAASERVLIAMAACPREKFVPESFRDQAYIDAALPLSSGQTISQPWVVATMTDALDVQPHHKVLEIGTGSGWQTAILARLAATVCSIERHAPLSRGAKAVLHQLGIANVRLRIGDGTLGWPEEAPFDRIMVTAAADKAPPPALLAQLSPEGGVMLIPVKEAEPDGEHLWRVTRTGKEISRVRLSAVRFVPLLPGMPKAK